MVELHALPGPLAELVGDAELLPVTVGRSGATTASVERAGGRWIVKLQRRDPLATSLVDEGERMRWLAAHLPVPEVVAVGEDGGTEWLVTAALDGSDATDPEHRRDLEGLVARLGRGLRRFHDAAPPDDCPFDASTATALDRARARLDAGVVDESGFGPLFSGMSAAELFEVMVASEPPPTDDPVVVHGDYCVPNVILRDGEISGYVDLGRAGVGDRHRDLAIALRSIAHNFGPEAVGLFVDGYGVDPDLARLDFYVMLDEFS